MLTRLTHAAVAFAVTAALYQVYAATVVPFVEPQGTAELSTADSPEFPRAAAGHMLQKYRPLLAAYFAADHWCFQPTVKIFENDQVLVVLNEYEQSQNGQLRVPKCAVIFFPQGWNRGEAPPRDAIVLEPSGGAVLQMDQQVGAHSFGRLQFGQLMGEVAVRSDMREPGPDDDLLITTRDLYMNEDFIRTSEPVQMRLGANFARGRSLEIHFLPVEGSRDLAAGKLYGSLESLEILKEVDVTLASRNPQPPNGAGPTPSDVEKSSQRLFEAPIRIRTGGSLRIDFANFVTSFIAGGNSAAVKDESAAAFVAPSDRDPSVEGSELARRVVVRQLHPDGKLDELQAEELDLFFRPAHNQVGIMAAAAPESAASSNWLGPADGSFSLEPESVEARGTRQAPVTLDAPSQEAAIRCEHLWIELRPRRLTVEGGEEVAVMFRGGEVHAPMVQYQLPPADSAAKVGTLTARGAGRFRSIVDRQKPTEAIEISWKKELKLIRRAGQPVLLLDGRPRLWMAGFGEMYADGLELFLRERRPEEVDQQVAAQVNALPAAVVPQRLTASGRVTIDSAELTCRVNQFDVKFNYPTAAAPSSNAGGGKQTEVAAGTERGDRRRPVNPLARDRSLGARRRSYDISAVTLKATCKVRDRQPSVTDIRVDGAVVFQEQSPALAAKPPLRITAERLHVARADAADSEIEIQGGGGQNGLPVQLAEIATPTAVLRAPALVIDRGTNQAWINSPGEIELLVSRDLAGQPLTDGQHVHITWQQAMELDQRRLTFRGDVFVEHESGWLRTQRLVAQLTAPPGLGDTGGGGNTDLEQIECWEGAVAEFDQRDAAGVSSHQHVEVQSLAVNQITGEIRGQGPGVVDSIHLSHGAGTLLDSDAIAGATAAIPSPRDASTQLRHLHIEFTRGVSGNLLKPNRKIDVLGDVRTVYGAVAAWDQRLVMSPGSAPEPGTIWITCDQLGVVESPLALIQTPVDQRSRGLGPVELVASGSVEIEGQHPTRGAFILRGKRASYDQAKTLFMLEGDGIRPATVTFQQYPGAPPTEESADKMFYNQATGEPSIKGVHKMQWQNFDGNSPPPAP